MATLVKSAKLSAIRREPFLAIPGKKPIGRVVPRKTENIKNLWLFDANGCTDIVGGKDGTAVNSPSYSTNVAGPARSFNETNQRYTVGTYSFPSAPCCIWFDIDPTDNTGSFFQYFISHGNFTSALNIYLTEAGAASPNELTAQCHTSGTELTSVGGISGGNRVTGCLRFESSTSFTMFGKTLGKGTAGAANVSITTSQTLYFGCRADLNVDRFYGGDMNAVVVTEGAMSDDAILRKLRDFYGTFFESANQSKHLITVASVAGSAPIFMHHLNQMRNR